MKNAEEIIVLFSFTFLILWFVVTFVHWVADNNMADNCAEVHNVYTCEWTLVPVREEP